MPELELRITHPIVLGDIEFFTELAREIGFHQDSDIAIETHPSVIRVYETQAQVEVNRMTTEGDDSDA